MADTFLEGLERARELQRQSPAPVQDDFVAGLDRARELAYGAREVEPTATAGPQKGTTQSLTLEDPTFMDRMETFGRGLRTGVPIVGDQLQNLHTGIRSRFRAAHSGQPVEDERAQLEAQATRQDRSLPGTKLAGEITGGVVATVPLVAAAPGAFGLANASRLENAARAGITSGLLSGTDAAARGRSPEEQVTSAVVGGTVSALLTPILGRIAGRATAPRSTAPSTVEQAQAAATRLYDAADNAGVRVAPQALANASADIRRAAVAANFDETLHPISARVMAIQSERAASGQPFSMRDLENIRRVTTNQMRAATNEDERRVLGVIRENFDDWLQKLGTRPGEVLSGDPAVAVAATREARVLWRRSAVAERIGEAVERGARHSSGLATGIRSEFRALANSDRFMRSLSAEERAEVKQLASIKNFRSLLTLVARLDPHRSMLNSGLGGVGGFMAGGPAGAVAVPLAGRTAASVSDKLMRSRAMSVQRGVLRGDMQKPQGQAGRTLGAAFGVELSRKAGAQ